MAGEEEAPREVIMTLPQKKPHNGMQRLDPSEAAIREESMNIKKTASFAKMQKFLDVCHDEDMTRIDALKPLPKPLDRELLILVYK